MIRAALLVLACAAATPAFAGDLVVKITGVKAKGGSVRVALYGKDPLYRDAVAIADAPAAAGEMTITVKNVPAGDYVVSAFHDADGDGKLGFAAGKLTEGTAISNAEKLRGAPTFAVNKIAVPASGGIATIAMSYPEDRAGW